MSKVPEVEVTAGMLVETTTLTAKQHKLFGKSDARPSQEEIKKEALNIDHAGEAKAIAGWLKGALPLLTIAELIKALANL